MTADQLKRALAAVLIQQDDTRECINASTQEAQKLLRAANALQDEFIALCDAGDAIRLLIQQADSAAAVNHLPSQDNQPGDPTA